jgi:hypothetical protein
MLIVPLEAMIVLPQPAEQRGDDLLYFLLVERTSVEISLGHFLANGVVVLPLEYKVEMLFIGTIARIIKMIMHPQFGDGLAFSLLILLDNLLDV